MLINSTMARSNKYGRSIRISSPTDAMAAGIAYCPKTGRHKGSCFLFPDYENLMMSTLDRYSPFGIVRGVRQWTATREIARRLQFRGNLSVPALMNSGR